MARSHHRRWFLLLLVAVALWLAPAWARAEVLQAPFGGKAIPIGTGRVACKPPGNGWVLDGSRRSVRPPPGNEAIGQSAELSIAPDFASCANSTQVLTLITTDHPPTLDPASVVLYVDEARLELRGRGLRGLGISWRTGDTTGEDVCRDPKPDPAGRQCTWLVSKNLPADPNAITLRWFPVGGRAGPDVKTFDAEGDELGESLVVTPARVVLTRLLPSDAAVDLSAGQGELALVHPEAVADVKCNGARCTRDDRRIVVRGQSKLVNAVDIRLQLVPHVYFKRADVLETEPTLRVSVLHCPMSVASGPPIRAVDSARVVIRLEGRCAKDIAQLHFFVGPTPVDILQTQTEDEVAWALLRLGSVDGNSLAITAVRGDLEDIPVAVARVPLRSTPQVRTTLEIPGYPPLAFIPNNRRATVHVAPVGDRARLVLLPLEGIYEATNESDRVTVQGDAYAEGLTSLRFGYRVESLPSPLNQVDLALLNDPLQRPIREANIPAPIDLASMQKVPLVEVLCGDGEGKVVRLSPGETARLSYRARDSCRLIVHRERLSAEYGTQKLNLEIDVQRSDGSARTEAHVAQTLVLRSGNEPRIAWIHGVSAPFDRIVVRLSHVADEAHYIGASELLNGEPSLKWTAILGTGHLRLYATSAIPTGLYRFGDAGHSGVLSLNFGVISRLTWLDSEGHEGLLGLEGGLMVIGLGGAQSTTGRSLTQVGVVAGVGLSIPIANRSSPTEAAINLHTWFERDIEAAGSDPTGRRWSIIFGPSISIGNVGANL